MTFREQIEKDIIPKLQEQLHKKHRLQVPRVDRITLNIGISTKTKDSKVQDAAMETLKRISGQKPVATKARKSVAGFKVREGMIVGVMVTLRGKRMYDFLEKFIRIALPRKRDFRGVPETAIDATGNLSYGFREHLAFPEIRSDEIELIHGLQVTLVTTAKTHDEGVALFSALGIPFITK